MDFPYRIVLLKRTNEIARFWHFIDIHWNCCLLQWFSYDFYKWPMRSLGLNIDFCRWPMRSLDRWWRPEVSTTWRSLESSPTLWTFRWLQPWFTLVEGVTTSLPDSRGISTSSTAPCPQTAPLTRSSKQSAMDIS